MLVRPFLVFLAAILIANSPQASPDAWERVGPQNGAIYSATIHPTNVQTIYFTWESGLGRTLDGGATWSSVPVAGYRVLFDPSNPNTIYTYSGLISKSTDGGTTWGTAISSFSAWSLAVDPDNSNRVFAGTGSPAGVYRSADGGATWALSQVTPYSSGVSAIRVDPSNGNNIYAGTSGDFDIPGEGVFKSTNGGVTWVNMSPGSSVSDLAIDPSNTAVVYAATSAGGLYSGQGILKSQNGGASWVQLSSGLPSPGTSGVAAITVDALHPGTVYAVVNSRLYRSTDSGDQWTMVDIAAFPIGISDISIEAGSGVLCLGSGTGVFVSDAAGETFTPWGITPAEVASVAVDRTDGNILLTNGRGTYQSMDGAAHWQPVAMPGFGISIMQDPVDPHIFYAGAYSGGGVSKSVDIGATWAISLAGKSINDVVVAPSNTSVVYAGGLDRPFVGGIYKSANAGGTWVTLSNSYGQSSAIAVDPTDDDVVYVAGQTGLIKSIDGGASWTRIENGLNEPASGWVHDVVIDPVHPEVVYCCTKTQGVFKSVDGGENWSRVTNSLAEVRAITIDAEDTQIVYAAAYAVGVFVSVNGGSTWQQLGPNASGGRDLEIDPTDRSMLYFAGSGLWRYERTSECVQPEISSHAPSVIDIDNCGTTCSVVFNVEPTGDYTGAAVVALERRSGDVWIQEDDVQAPLPAPFWQLSGTFDETDPPGEYEFRAVMRCPDGSRAVSDAVVVSVVQGPTSLAIPGYVLELRQNRPNPFNPSTTISFTTPVADRARLAIYNVGGERVTTLMDQSVPAGDHEVVWDGSDSAGNPVGSGVYFYRLTTPSQTLIRKMVLLK